MRSMNWLRNGQDELSSLVRSQFAPHSGHLGSLLAFKKADMYLGMTSTFVIKHLNIFID